MSLRRGALLIAAGLVSEVVYLAASRRLSWWSYGGRLWSWVELLGEVRFASVICVVGIGLLMTAYLCGWHAVRLGEGNRWLVWSFAGLFAVTLFWLMPITSDLFSYLSRAHLFTDLGGNPLLEAPLEYQDPLVQAYPTFYSTLSTAYGPAWLLGTAPGTLGRHDVAAGLFYLKGLAVIAYLGCCWLLEQIMRWLRPAAAVEGLYLFAWNPLVLLMAIGDGHNDIVMMALVLLALWLLMREDWLLSFGALTLSLWIKYVSTILLPLVGLYAWRRVDQKYGRRRWTLIVQASLVVASVSILLFAPFWEVEGLSVLAQRVIWPENWRGGSTSFHAGILYMGLILFGLAYAAVVWWSLRKGGSFQQLGNACFIATLLAVVLGAVRGQPWYLIWPASLAGLTEWRWAWPVVVGMSGIMLMAQLWVEWGAAGASLLG